MTETEYPTNSSTQFNPRQHHSLGLYPAHDQKINGAIAAVVMERNVQHLMLEGQDWTLIEEIVAILQPFQKATEAMSAVNYSTLHKFLWKN